MANRYWRGGAGTWDTTTTTNWSTSSGGSGGASVPTAADSVFFDQAGTYSVTCNGALTCLNITVSAGTVTFVNGTSFTLTVSGSLTFLSSTVFASGGLTFNATTTGKTVAFGTSLNSSVTFDGVGGGWTLGSAYSNPSNEITITNGTFDTSSVGNYAVTTGDITSTNSNTRTINLNASTISISSFNVTTTTGLTFNAGTSTINYTSSTPAVTGSGLTYYNVSFTGVPVSSATITGANTFNNLSVAGRTTVGLTTLTLSGNQTINGTLTLSAGTASAYRTMVLSNIISTPRTLTVATIASLTDIDFRDIVAAGASGTWSGTRLGDCGGNSNITLTSARTHFFAQTGSANWGATGAGSWASTSGGATNANRFPLAQDTAIFPAATYPASGSTTTINANYNIGTIDMSLRTSNTMTLATGVTQTIVYGNWINGTGITLSGTQTITFSGRTTQTITSASKTFTQPITINSPSGSVTLQDALTQGSVTTTLTNGTLNLNGKTLTVGLRLSTANGTKNLTFNGGTLVCPNANTTSFNNSFPTGFTTTAGTGTGTISMTAATAKTFVGAGSTFNCTLNQGGAGALTITGSNTFSNITNTRKSTSATSILFTAGTTSTFTDWNASGESTRLLTIGSVTAAIHTLSKASGTVSADFLSISRSTATGGAGWYAGANSTDGGNNSGWIFTAPPSAPTATGNFLVFF